MKYVKEIKNHKISGVMEIVLDPHYDNRGEIWSIYEKTDLFPEFVEDKVSISTKNVLRGLHGDDKTGKLINCLYGEFFLVIVDYRKNSDTYLDKVYFQVSDKNPTLIYVPPGCLNGHLCLSEKCIFFYKWTEKYTGPEDQITVRWDDPTLCIEWPHNSPIISSRDASGSIL